MDLGFKKLFTVNSVKCFDYLCHECKLGLPFTQNDKTCGHASQLPFRYKPWQDQSNRLPHHWDKQNCCWSLEIWKSYLLRYCPVYLLQTHVFIIWNISCYTLLFYHLVLSSTNVPPIHDFHLTKWTKSWITAVVQNLFSVNHHSEKGACAVFMFNWLIFSLVLLQFAVKSIPSFENYIR